MSSVDLDKKIQQLNKEVIEEPVTAPVKHTKTSIWKKEDDKILAKAVKLHNGQDWDLISTFFSDKNATQCLHRWKKVLDPKLKKGSWSMEEDLLLTNAVKKYKSSWPKIALVVEGRTPKQCRERWKNQLDPSIDHGPWRTDENEILIAKHKIYGNKWSKIKEFLPGRPDNVIKNRWNTTLKKRFPEENKKKLPSTITAHRTSNNLKKKKKTKSNLKENIQDKIPTKTKKKEKKKLQLNLILNHELNNNNSSNDIDNINTNNNNIIKNRRITRSFARNLNHVKKPIFSLSAKKKIKITRKKKGRPKKKKIKLNPKLIQKRNNLKEIKRKHKKEQLNNENINNTNKSIGTNKNIMSEIEETIKVKPKIEKKEKKNSKKKEMEKVKNNIEIEEEEFQEKIINKESLDDDKENNDLNDDDDDENDEDEDDNDDDDGDVVDDNDDNYDLEEKQKDNDNNVIDGNYDEEDDDDDAGDDDDDDDYKYEEDEENEDYDFNYLNNNQKQQPKRKRKTKPKSRLKTKTKLIVKVKLKPKTKPNQKLEDEQKIVKEQEQNQKIKNDQSFTMIPQEKKKNSFSQLQYEEESEEETEEKYEEEYEEESEEESENESNFTLQRNNNKSKKETSNKKTKKKKINEMESLSQYIPIYCDRDKNNSPIEKRNIISPNHLSFLPIHNSNIHNSIKKNNQIQKTRNSTQQSSNKISLNSNRIENCNYNRSRKNTQKASNNQNHSLLLTPQKTFFFNPTQRSLTPTSSQLKQNLTNNSTFIRRPLTPTFQKLHSNNNSNPNQNFFLNHINSRHGKTDINSKLKPTTPFSPNYSLFNQQTRGTQFLNYQRALFSPQSKQLYENNHLANYFGNHKVKPKAQNLTNPKQNFRKRNFNIDKENISHNETNIIKKQKPNIHKPAFFSSNSSFSRETKTKKKSIIN
ncbi:myb DNA-binding domain superfamily protein-related [Anaeramoeba flamelloides]|uniref:Myb DNA-binding domain superfamily protein-related n=1 Tax=Anaeramoeba flamelloides TaxID=1746091 RepID=A0AAV7YPV9_9EUKA|nr:myb DNA-binding domain superfamily protein-related [Anaeramoeba flamelloides]